MKRITIRVSNEQAEALAAHGAGDMSRGARRLIVDHLGVGEVSRPYTFDDPAKAQAAAKSRWTDSLTAKRLREKAKQKRKKSG